VNALSCGKKVASANKESIVMGWDLIKSCMQYEDQLIPVDSEHSAVLQSLKGERLSDVSKIILTASGGAVYKNSLEELGKIRAEDCLSHPTWDMGHKITIDSATLMNKGLEVIEAHNLFAVDYSNIDVYIHPQSVIHGMVEFNDGTIIACLATQDMKIPIQYALTHPERKSLSSKKLSIEKMRQLEFKHPDTDRFPCLKIAMDAGKKGGLAPVVMCAADDVAVEAFTNGNIGFMQISEIITEMLDKNITGSLESAEEIEMVYSEAKKIAEEIIY
jgi:1-deoxy-D-xylulose-5-phosphate reductoisomerase